MAHTHTHNDSPIVGGHHSHGGHSHSHAPTNFGTAFAIGTTLNLAFVIIEVIYGLRAHSLTLVADAGHNLGDVLGLVLAWGAAVLSRRFPTKQRTYGMRRSSILAALTNAIVLLVTVGGIGFEAIRRLTHPATVEGHTVIVVAAIGIVINTGTALLFMSGRKGDVNIRGAFLHMAADAAVSAGVVIAGLVIAATGWLWVDPIVSLIIVLIIVLGTWSLLGESMNLAMDAVPESADAHAIEEYLAALPGVTEVHDLHIWGLSTTETALTAHLVIPEVGDHDSLLLDVCRILHDRFSIEHPTLQVEHIHAAASCVQARPDTL